ncbi:DUF4232 domain-containing protein [Streptomyces sp. NPDC059850]|uniref:DUF4232 domain-containing protein n=1 Tax=Streptomyces sp. NPDC059850 TaxID=3346970 RepID=UPI0036541244
MSHRISIRNARKVAAAAVVATAALGLTACQGNANAQGDTSSAASSSSSGSGSSSGDSIGSKAGSAGGSGACKTSQLGFRTSHGMGEGILNISLKNNGSATCTLQGFPGADLKGKDGTVSAERSDLDAPKTSIKPGEETGFALYYPSNDSGGSGVTFTKLIVTPPDETHSSSLPVSINVPVSDGSGPAIKVDPVGSGKWG